MGRPGVPRRLLADANAAVAEMGFKGPQTEHLVAWVEDSVAQDAARLTRWRPGAAEPNPKAQGAVSNGEASIADQCDVQVWRAFTRLQNVMALPAEVLDDAAVATAVARVLRIGLAAAGR